MCAVQGFRGCLSIEVNRSKQGSIIHTYWFNVTIAGFKPPPGSGLQTGLQTGF